MSRSLRWFSVLILLAGMTRVDAADFFFRDGDVVVMIGDSITEQHLYSNYVELWTVTRFPKWKLTFRNVGIGGDRSPGGNQRFARDVLIHKPTAMTVDFGMNDGGYRAFEPGTFDPYMTGLQGMADQAKSHNIRTAWVTPQPLDNANQGSTAMAELYNQTLEKFSEGVKTTAERNGGLFVDQFHPYIKVLDAARAGTTTYQRITGGDAVHPGPPGQALMAASILKGLSFPAQVSSAVIDAKTLKVDAASNCKIDELKGGSDGIVFSRLDDALPFFPADATSILTWAPLLEEMNQYQLRVTGLAGGNYEVRIGGAKTAVFSAEQLAAGVNLASAVLASGPIAEQVNAVQAAVEAKNGYHHKSIFRGIVLSSNVPEWVYEAIPRADLENKKQAIIQERLAKLLSLDAEVAKTLVMKPVAFEISPAK
ncbi:SGNH/GDSL hydrolase family protein [Schlesneria paludicola]|uniref:SGNH/GDSL hydrolase family protein n=1 Tax=Schlesneria paludicola TaxID=360056 RepID=UPI0002DF3F3F|nr:SGNH/GDSL hydrolase family protein [Schlesneria paludicola]